MSTVQGPKLRAIDFRPIVQRGRPALLLLDPLRLAEESVVLPRQLAPVLALCDGTRDVGGLRSALALRFGLRVGIDVLEQLVTALDRALLLENEGFTRAHERALQAYRTAPFRPPLLAGHSYPAKPDALHCQLDAYAGAAEDISRDQFEGRGLISPHIDYERGGTVYARVWKGMTERTQQAERVVLLGTDHYGPNGRLTLTRQDYATPFGSLPTAQTVVDQLARVLGEEDAFDGELYHRNEHSIELAAVWLHHVRAGRPCELVPILCGSFADFVQGPQDPQEDPGIGAAADLLAQELTAGQTLIVAAADLAHVGPAFGGEPLGRLQQARLRALDEELIAQMCAGDAAGFFAAIRRVGDRHNVCGLPPIYLTLRALSPTEGQSLAYEQCPADGEGTSLVSVCGIVFD